MSLSFSGDGRWVATADNDGYVRVYDANTGKLRSTAEGFVVEPFAVAFSQDGKFVIAGSADKTISIIDPETGKVLRTLSRQPELIMSLDVSADGKQVALIYGYADHFLDVDRLALWDVDKGMRAWQFGAEIQCSLYRLKESPVENTLLKAGCSSCILTSRLVRFDFFRSSSFIFLLAGTATSPDL